MRCFAVIAAGALLTGCYVMKPVTEPQIATHVRVQYRNPLPSVTVASKARTVEIPAVSLIEGDVLAIRGDSVDVRVLRMTPSWDGTRLGLTTISMLPDSARSIQWGRPAFSRNRTAALLAPPMTVLAIYAVAAFFVKSIPDIHFPWPGGD